MKLIPRKRFYSFIKSIALKEDFEGIEISDEAKRKLEEEINTYLYQKISRAISYLKRQKRKRIEIEDLE